MEMIEIGGLKIARIDFKEGYPERGEPPNAYIVVCKPAVVVDTAFGTERNLLIFQEALTECRLKPSDIGHVILTHWHWDHTGLAPWLAENTNANLLVHDAEMTRITGGIEEISELAAATARFYKSHGFAKEDASSIVALAFIHQHTGIPRARVSVIGDGHEIETDAASFTVLHTPGHTPGSICLHEARTGTLFSSDTLYERLFPHPVAEIATASECRRSVLWQYQATLKKLRLLESPICLPGHGAPFSPAEKVISTISRFIERRLLRLLRLLGSSDSQLNAAQVLDVFFPGIREQDLYHAVAEVILLLEVAEDRGLIRRVQDSEGKFAFLPT